MIFSVQQMWIMTFTVNSSLIVQHDSTCCKIRLRYTVSSQSILLSESSRLGKFFEDFLNTSSSVCWNIWKYIKYLLYTRWNISDLLYFSLIPKETLITYIHTIAKNINLINMGPHTPQIYICLLPIRNLM